MGNFIVKVLTVTCMAGTNVFAEELAQVEGQKLKLDQQTCVVEIEKGEKLKIDLRPPCFFVKSSGKGDSARMEYVADLKVNVLIVGGSPTAESGKAEVKLGKPILCGEETQGIIYDKKTWKLGSYKGTSMLVCSDKVGLDAKNYWMHAAWKKK